MLASSGWLAGCAVSPQEHARQSERCDALLSVASASAGQALDPENISLLNWNTAKAGDRDLAEVLREAGDGVDLYLLQEAVPRHGRHPEIDAGTYAEFAQGFTLGHVATGVMTLGHSPPLAACRLTAREPLFGTRKATLVTRYALSGSPSSLLVINIHGVNFSLGLGALESQLAVLADLVEAHDGPAILSGDFNTWRRSRYALLERYMSVLGMQPVAFDEDHRKRFFSWPLDHVYARGLQTMTASSWETDGSDHNPMYVLFRVDAGAM